MVLYVIPQEWPREICLKQKKLDNEAIESVTTFFQALFKQKMLDGTIKRQEADPIHKRLHRKASEKLRRQIREASDGWRSQCARRKITLCDDWCRYVADQGDWSRCHHIDNNRSGNNCRPSYGVLKRYRCECLACDGYRLCNNQPRERKLSAGCKKMARARAPRAKCTAIRVARQSMSGPNAWRTQSIKRSQQQSAQKHTMLTTSVALRVTLQASATTARRWQATSPAKGTVVAWITPTTKTTLPSPSWPCLASKPNTMYYLLKRSWPSQCRVGQGHWQQRSIGQTW